MQIWQSWTTTRTSKDTGSTVSSHLHKQTCIPKRLWDTTSFQHNFEDGQELLPLNFSLKYLLVPYDIMNDQKDLAYYTHNAPAIYSVNLELSLPKRLWVYQAKMDFTLVH